jgi:hypothetical protein
VSESVGKYRKAAESATKWPKCSLLNLRKV